jgi:hypothetical protein
MKTIKEELLQISNDNNGLLKPEVVVEFARDPETALHSKFEWDDAKAGHNYRLWQARQVISLEFSVIESEKPTKETRLFVSLTEDRKEGGYRLITDVLSDEALLDRMLKDALSELIRIKTKYNHLQELSKVFAEVDKVQQLEFA